MTESELIKLRIDNFLDEMSSDELLLLKGHLLIEETLDLLNIHFIEANAYKQMSLSFHKKILLFAGLTHIDLKTNIIMNVLEINRIRNRFAHNLEARTKEDLIEFIKSNSGGVLPKTINRNSTYLNSLKRCIYFLLGELYGIYEGYKAANAT